MNIREGRGLTPPPAHSVNQYRQPTLRAVFTEKLKGLIEPDQFLELTDAARTQREISSIVRATAHQLGIKITVRFDPDEKTVRIWRKS